LNQKILSILIFLCLILLSRQLLAWETLTNELDINCLQTAKTLACEYRTLSKKLSLSISASANNTKLQVIENNQYSENGDTTAILFLVDTSDPGRQNVIEKNKIHIKKLLTTLKPDYKAGLASFDKTLQLQSPLGTSVFLLSKSLASLKAAGKTTELYRSLLKAIEYLNSFEAKRKVIVLLSDGQAEDKAYFHSDIIKAARRSGIIINSIGYPRSVSLSVALQTIRRLSEETGGSYIETDMDYNLPENYFKQAFNNIDNTGSFSVALNELYQSIEPTNAVKITFKIGSDIKNINVPVTIKTVKNNTIQKPVPQPQTKIASVEQSSSIKSTANNLPIQVITKQATTQQTNLWLWYGLPAAFIIIIVFILLTLFLLWDRKPKSKTNNIKDEYKPYAYLISNDENEIRYPITRTIWRIGRSKDNELNLDDTSISRRHAEIHRNSNGSFDIIDMNSMNGVYINNEKVGKAELHEGDIVEIGDFFLHFTQLASDYSLEESTVMQKTRTPNTH
jgi:FHA domain-containing protein/von Willebrand factor type A domain-containing protein